jgi:hypothetical protein
MILMNKYCVSKWDGLNTRRRVRLKKFRSIEELTTRLSRQYSEHENKSNDLPKVNE